MVQEPGIVPASAPSPRCFVPRNGTETRTRILDAAQKAVLERGFAATSVDAIQQAAGISRGTFFYHFPSKDDLARTLIERYAEADREVIDSFMAKAEKLSRDPLQQVLIFITLHEDLFQNVDGVMPGCLFASYSYEAGLFDDRTHALIDESIAYWRTVFGGKIREAVSEHPPVVPVDPVAVADLAYSVLQGAYVLARVQDDMSLMAEHVRHFRTHVELLFGVAGTEA